MAHRAVIGDDCRGPVAEATTRERCNALYPGSNPGRASSLRWLRQLRLGKPAKRASLILLSLPKAGLPRRSSKSEGGSLRWLRQLRLGKPAKRASLILLSLPKTGLPRRTSKSEGGSSKSEGGFNGHE